MKSLKKYFLHGKLPLFLLVTILITGGSCRKPVTYMVPESFKRYFYFPVGSWWVYKNQLGVVDTLTIRSKSTNIVEKSNSYKVYEKIIISYYSSLAGSFSAATYYYGNVFSFCSITSPIYLTDIADFTFNTEGEAQTFNAQIKWWVEDTVEVNKNPYYDVVVNITTIGIPPLIKDFPIKAYYKEDIGLIKRELQNGEIWELVDYKINK